jgi:hypothetical protein
MAGMLPYDLNDLAAGAVRVIVHPVSTTLFKTPHGAFDPETPYEPTTDGRDLGATTGPITYDRNFTVQGLKIEQSTANVLEVPDEMIRQIHIPMGEITPANIGIFENSDEIGTIAAAAGHSAFATLSAGDISDVTAYRVTVVGMRQKQQGIVVESDDTTERGRFYGFIAYRATFTADSSTISFGKGALASMTVTLKLYPESSEPAGKNQIIWFDETAGTIA